MNARRPRRWPGRVAATAPVVLLIAAAVAATWGFVVVHNTFGDASLAQQIYSTMAMFSGGYLALNGANDPAIPAGMAWPSIIAFGVTIIAAGTVVVTLSTKARNVIRALAARPELVVVGSDRTAAAIVGSCVEKRVRALLITERRDSPAARACLHVIPTVTIGSLAETGRYGVSKRVLRRGVNVVIATDSDSTNLELRRRVIRASTTSAVARRSVIAVVNDAELVEAMRPREIRDLGEEEVTCPAENIAEHVCLLIDAAATGSAAIGSARSTDDTSGTRLRSLVGAVAVEVVDATGSSDVADTVYRWAVRQAWGRGYLQGDQIVGKDEYNPIVPITVNHEPDDNDLIIRIYCGNDGSRVVRRVIQDRADTSTRAADLTIVVADRQLTETAAETSDGTAVISGWRWLVSKAELGRAGSGPGTVLVVDPDRVGLDASLVVDDVRLQWARVFDQTYRLMFAADRAIDWWLPGAPLGHATAAAEAAAVAALPAGSRTNDAREEARFRARKAISDRLSSEAAVRNMIRFLQGKEWKLVRYEGSTLPPRPDIDDAVVGDIAKLEHEDWCKREWTDTSPRRFIRLPRNKLHTCAEFSRKKLGGYTWEGLLAQKENPNTEIAAEFAVTVNYNKRIVTETYPAIAARFGYQIVHSPESDGRC